MLDDHKSRGIAFGIPLILILFAYIPLMAAHFIPLGFDATTFFLPLLRLASELVQSGDWPSWTDRIGTGYPLFASTQINLTYPAFLPLLFTKDPAHWISELLLVHLLIGALGGIWLGKRLETSVWAMALGGVLFSISMPVLGFANRPVFFCANAYIPWVIGAALGRKFTPLIWALSMALCATISMEIAAYLLPISILLRILWYGKGAYNKSMNADLLLASLIFVALILPVLLPFVEFLTWSERGDPLGTWRITANAFSTPQLLQFIAPPITGFLPSGFESIFNLPIGQEARFGQLQWIAAPVAGVLILPLTICAVLKSVPARKVLVLIAALMLIAMPTTFSLILSLWHYPPFSLVRFPGKMMQIVWPLLAMTTMIGVDQIGISRKKAFIIFSLSAALSGLLLMLPAEVRISLIKSLSVPEQHVATLSSFWSPALITAVTFLLGSAFAIALGKSKTGPILTVLVILESGYLGLSAFDVVTLPPSQETIATPIRELAEKPHPRVSVYVSSGNGILDQMHARDLRARYLETAGGGASLWGHGLATEQSFTGIQLRGIQKLDDILFDKLPGRMRAFGTDFLLIGKQLSMPEELLSVASWPDAGIELFKLKEAMKPVFVANSIILAGSKNDMEQLLREHADDLVQTAILSQVIQAENNPDATAEISQRNSKLVKINVTTDRPTLIWTADAMGPGWSVTVNDLKSNPISVQDAFRGVVVPAGKSEVVWSFRPISFWLGILGSVLIFLLCALTKIRRRIRTTQPYRSS